MSFNFNCSVILYKAHLEGDDVVLNIGPLRRVPRDRVQCIVIGELDDMSTVVVDFPPGFSEYEAIIAAGCTENLPQI